MTNMKITYRQAQVTFDKKDKEALGRVINILNKISEAIDMKDDDLIIEDGLVYSNEDIKNVRDLFYYLTTGNVNIGVLDDEEEDDVEYEKGQEGIE